MNKKKKSNPGKLSERSSKKDKDPYEETKPAIKEMPDTSHPHQEEILD